MSTATAPLVLTVGTGKSYTIGMGLHLIPTANTANNINGKITAYNSATGLLTLNPIFKTGSGTFSSWKVSSGNYHHNIHRLKIFANYVHDCGWDGIQCTGANRETEIHDNLFVNNGTSEVFAQNFSLTCGNGFAGQIYNNIFDRFIQIFPSGTTLIYNNFIPGQVGGSVNNAVFIRRYDNPFYIAPSGDSYQHCDPTANVYLFNNIIQSIQDPVYVFDGTDDGTSKVPFNTITYINNTVTWSGTAQESSGLRYAEGTGATQNFNINNYIAPTISSIKIVNATGNNISLYSTSPVFSLAKEGVDLTIYISSTTLSNLFVGLTDLSGQSYPLRGRFYNTPIQRFYGYKPPLRNEEQFQWYQVSGISGTTAFIGKMKILDLHGASIKKYKFISVSNKSRYLMSVKPVAKTGNLLGNETFNNISQS
jgi:hypothetical protein